MKDAQSPWKSAAVGRFQNGDTIRTQEFRYTEYTDRNGQHISQMLYDHRSDSDEDTNVADSSRQTVMELASELHSLKGTDAQ